MTAPSTTIRYKKVLYKTVKDGYQNVLLHVR